MKLDIGNNSRKYKVKTICNSMVYIKKSVGYLLGLYYLIFWKNYLKKKYLRTYIGYLAS